MQGTRVSGFLTIDPELDAINEWVLRQWFYKPNLCTCTKFMRDVEPGIGVGQYVTRAEYLEGSD